MGTKDRKGVAGTVENRVAVKLKAVLAKIDGDENPAVERKDLLQALTDSGEHPCAIRNRVGDVRRFLDCS